MIDDSEYNLGKIYHEFHVFLQLFIWKLIIYDFSYSFFFPCIFVFWVLFDVSYFSQRAVITKFLINYLERRRFFQIFEYSCSAFFQILSIIGMEFCELFQIATCLCKPNHQHVNAKIPKLTKQNQTPPLFLNCPYSWNVELKVLESLNLIDKFISVLNMKSELALLQMPFAPGRIAGRTLMVFKIFW